MPTPAPGPGEVLVRLAASGVNPSDWKMRRGGGGRALVAPLIVPHSDGAGVIDAVGDGVPAARIGERVWTWNAQWRRAFGTAADYVALPSAQAVPLHGSFFGLASDDLGMRVEVDVVELSGAETAPIGGQGSAPVAAR